MSTLTTTQKSILEAAAGRPDGAIYPMPNHIMGGAALKVIKALADKKLIRDAGNNDWRIADEGFRAIGLEPPKPVEDFEADVAAAEESFTESKPRRRRENSKQAQVIEMLKRPEGATAAQIAEITGWQGHTIRGFLSIARKKLGLEITTQRNRVVGPQGSPGSFTIYFAQ